MGNWVNSHLYIKGDPKRVKEFIKGLIKDGETQSVLEAYFPVPSEHQYKNDGRWCSILWGTSAVTNANLHYIGSWENLPIKDVLSDNTEKFEQVCITFESSWSPPLEGLDVIATDFDDLQFKITYIEDGQGYNGTTHWVEGNRTTDWVRDLLDGPI